MNDYFIVVLVEIIASSGLVAFVHWKYGNGLLTKLFRVIIISIVILTYLAFILGKVGISSATLILISSTAAVVVIFMVTMIQKTAVMRVQAQANAVSMVIRNLTQTSNESAASAEEQAASVSQVSSVVDEIHQMSKKRADTSQNVATVSGEALQQGQEGLELVRELHEVMEKFAHATDFVNVVNHVAEQSNLLAFNAGIEAAKAEEYGRGFSVVAAEVRLLAEQSKQAANKIRETIRNTENGQRAAASTNEVITRLATVLYDASTKARQISGAAMQQSAGIKQIAEAMTNLVQTGKHTATTSRQIKTAAGQLDQVSTELLDILHGKSRTGKISTQHSA
jgi:methyl-accepting chemotaxis protein